jgi:HD-GYP domain-containing protein (c-di-GMP phosphodiesterase class II)
MYAKEIKELFQSFVNVMTKAIDERSPYTVNHTHHVAAYAERFVRFLSEKYPPPHEYHFNENRREQLVMASLLHDVGKIVTPRRVMDKPDRLGARLEIIKYKFEIKRRQTENDYLKGKLGKEEYDRVLTELADAMALVESVNTAEFLPDEKLGQVKKLTDITYLDETDETAPVFTAYDIEALTVRKGTLTDGEREMIQEHASVTSRLLSMINFNQYYKDVPRWAESHHEFIDGTGYPNRLSGDEVTTEMRILTMIDIYDALTARDRPYKRAMPPEKALGILSSMTGEGKLHSELVQLFIESGAWESVEA